MTERTGPVTQRRDHGRVRLAIGLASGALAVLVVAAWWLSPEFRDGAREAWSLLREGDVQRLRDRVQQFGIWGPVAVIALMVLQMFLIVAPSWLLMVIANLAYGPLWGGLLSVAAVAVASSVGYALGHVLGCRALERLLGASKIVAVRRETERYGLWAVVVARLNPLLSNDAISLLGGVLGLGFVKFMAGTLAGIAPLALAIAVSGEDWASMKSGLVALSVLSLAGLVVKIVHDRHVQD